MSVVREETKAASNTSLDISFGHKGAFTLGVKDSSIKSTTTKLVI